MLDGGAPSDAGTGFPDAGIPSDAGIGIPDAGFPGDAGNPDGGVASDAGAGIPDAGTSHPDAGPPSSDAGIKMTDAGPSATSSDEAPVADAGCGCRTPAHDAPSGLVSWATLVAVVLAGARRRRSALRRGA